PRTGFAYGAILNTLDNAQLARDGGFNLMSAYVAWSAVEPRRGQYIFEQQDQWGRTAANDLTNVLNAARGSGLKVGLRLDAPPEWAGGSVYRLDPADVEDYVFHTIRYAAGTIGYVEVFNEMNLPLEWGTSPVDPGAYARILAGAYRGARRADPKVTVVSAAPSQRTGGVGGTMEDVDWLNAFYDAGGAASFDALGVHAYLGSFDPTTDPACSPMCFRDLELYRAVMEQHGDAQKRGVITEFGTLEQTSIDLGPYAWMELPSDARADYLVQALRMANAQYPWLLGATVFNLDYATTMPRTSERGWFSLLRLSTDGKIEPTLAYTKIKEARASGYLP
ncbi:MAG: beta-galactosidase, partial [Chloroflexi bacterium]|nr:beta-galactosidase [Chloroflexota bacterium]